VKKEETKSLFMKKKSKGSFLTSNGPAKTPLGGLENGPPPPPQHQRTYDAEYTRVVLDTLCFLTETTGRTEQTETNRCFVSLIVDGVSS